MLESLNRTVRIGLIAGFLGVSFAPATNAQASFSYEQIVTALMPQMAADRGVTRPNQNANAVALQASGQPVAKLQVGFEGESHLLTVDGMKTLRTLAAALEDPRLQNSKFQILAYAYTPNAPASAQPVSARRAQTVLEHLQGFYGMGTDKFLGVQGMGASALNSGNAADPMNQRIEIVNIGNL